MINITITITISITIIIIRVDVVAVIFNASKIVAKSTPVLLVIGNGIDAMPPTHTKPYDTIRYMLYKYKPKTLINNLKM